MVEAHPPDRSPFHRLPERGLGHWRPAIRRIVDLHEQVVCRQIGVVDGIRRPDVIDREAFLLRRLLRPPQRRVSEGLVNRLARFGQGDDATGAARDLGLGLLDEQSVDREAGIELQVEEPDHHLVPALVAPGHFSLNGNQGLNIFAPGFPASQPIAGADGAALDDVEETVAVGASSLTYDADADRYT